MQPTLVILAAGVGSRFGGLKQLVPVGPGGSPLLDYTVFDAIRGGFGKVVLVVRRETDELFREHLNRGMGSAAEIVLVHQELDNLPAGWVTPKSRRKPWGTGHAVMVAAEEVDGPFAVANADDYYGPEGLAAVASFLGAGRGSIEPPEQWAMIGYRLGKTLPEIGSVSRGLCRQDGDRTLLGLYEILKIERAGDHAVWIDEDGVAQRQAFESLVSMNLWGFSGSFMGMLERGFEEFLGTAPSDQSEFLLPEAVSDAMAAGAARVAVLPCESEWFGMTSPGDREIVEDRLAKLVEAGVYPRNLWSD